MSRASWKGYFYHKSYLQLHLKKKIIIWSKNSIITSNFKDKIVYVYNGKEFKKIIITGAKIGFKFGQFVATKKYTQKYKSTIKKNKK